METGHLFDEIDRAGFRYDIILVDPFHTYEISYRDLVCALDVVTDRGTIVVHDCLPAGEDLISPEFVPGPWCGLTFMAFVDFVRERSGLAYLTVDTDCGCGVIRRGNDLSERSSQESDAWAAARSDPKAAYSYMIENKSTVLNLLSVDAFKDAELCRSRAHLLTPREYR
jgi:hypothetical protein